MSSPRHLWSGDWELDSAAAREELAKRRAQVEEPAEIPSVATPPRARPSAAAIALAWFLEAGRHLPRLLKSARRAVAAQTARGRQLRIALAIVLVGLLSAGAAYGVTTMLVGSSASTTGANSAHAWLGIDVSGSPLGIQVTDVVPNGPAGKAGMQTGDLITAINNQPVGTVDAVNAALAGLHSGDKIAIQFTRNLATYTTLATLAPRPPGYP